MMSMPIETITNEADLESAGFYWRERDGVRGLICGPLESAATLGIMRHFRVYKPARENAAFLEIEHLDRRYLGRVFNPTSGDPPTLQWDERRK